MKKMLDKAGISQGATSGSKLKRRKGKGHATATGASATNAPKADFLSSSMASKKVCSFLWGYVSHCSFLWGYVSHLASGQVEVDSPLEKASKLVEKVLKDANSCRILGCTPESTDEDPRVLYILYLLYVLYTM